MTKDTEERRQNIYTSSNLTLEQKRAVFRSPRMPWPEGKFETSKITLNGRQLDSRTLKETGHIQVHGPDGINWVLRELTDAICKGTFHYLRKIMVVVKGPEDRIRENVTPVLMVGNKRTQVSTSQLNSPQSPGNNLLHNFFKYLENATGSSQ